MKRGEEFGTRIGQQKNKVGDTRNPIVEPKSLKTKNDEGGSRFFVWRTSGRNKNERQGLN